MLYPDYTMIGYKNRLKNINGKVLDKYLIDQNNIGVIVKDEYGKKYSMEFNTKGDKPSLLNGYDLFTGLFYEKQDSIDKLIHAGDYIGVNVSYTKNPLKSVYQLNYVSTKPVTLADRKKYYLGKNKYGKR